MTLRAVTRDGGRVTPARGPGGPPAAGSPAGDGAHRRRSSPAFPGSDVFSHAVPEVTPFVAFALAGRPVPLPLTVMQVLAIDLGTGTLPALALSREPAELGLMGRPPRPRTREVITGRMLACAWGFPGLISAALVLAGFFVTLRHGGWRLGASQDPRTPAARPRWPG